MIYKKVFSILLIVLIASCGQRVQKEDLTQLNGYWEIEKVVLQNGEVKEYQVNPTVDYIEIKNNKGLRKKVYPKFDGSFETTHDAENFSIIDSNDVLILTYKKNSSSWQEELLTLNSNNFSVKNEDDITYHYKKFTPINITP